MRLLFEMDKKNYAHCTRRFVRNSARSIIIRDGKIAMILSLKYDYYKFPGGGIGNGENPVEAMIRETREEAGLVVKPETVREYGYVHRIQRSDKYADECFVQDNYYYLCQAEQEAVRQDLDAYEAQEAYTLEFVAPLTAIQKNRSVGTSPYNPMMFEREARVLELLISEGYFQSLQPEKLMQFEIRDALKEDAAAIAALCINELGYQTSGEQVKEKLTALLKNSQDRIFVAAVDGQVVGFIHAASYETLYFPPLKNLLGLAVAADYRHRGVGSALLDAVEAWAKETGASGVRLNSGSTRADAHQFYRKHGYGTEKQQLRLIKCFEETEKTV